MNIAIPGYEILEKVGLGGMAQVYRARHLRLNRFVALKVMLDRLSDDPSFSERFVREARIAAGLNHPNIVQIYDVDRAGKFNYLSMELVGGGDLKAKLNRPLDHDQLLDIVGPIAQALDYAHSQGYIHRDIKPGNILFRENGTPVVSDFGIARAIHSDTHMTHTGDVIGTPNYMSPEQAQGRTLDGRSDLYSLAVIIYQIVTGQLPFDGDSSITVAVKHVTAPIPKLDGPLSHLQPFFNRALAKDPADRYQTGGDMVAALQAFLTGGEPTNLARNLEKTALYEPSGTSSTRTVAGSETAPPLSGEVLSRPMPSIKLIAKTINEITGFVRHQKRGRVLVVLAALLLVGAGAYWLVLSDGRALQAEAPLAPAQRLRIQQLFASAELDLVAQRLSRPAGNNAYEKYLAILAIEPGNQNARAGIDTITRQLLADAEAAMAGHDWQKAGEQIRQAQSINPGYDGIAPLKAQLETARQQEVTKITQLVEAAALSKQAGDWAGAARTYAEVLELEADNNLARQGIEDITRGYVQLAGEYLAREDFERAGQQIELAERAGSLLNDSDITAETAAFKQQLERTVAAKERNRRIRQLQAQAESAFAASRLVEPDKNNAHYFYRQILALDSGNREAGKGIEKVLERLRRDAEVALQAGDVGTGGKALRQLESVAPGDAGLRDLRYQLRQAQQRAEQQRELQAKVDVLYGRADRYLAAGRVTSADKIYRRIVGISSNDKGLPKLRQRLADGFAMLAQKEYDAEDWSDVFVWTQRGLAYVPDHPGLLELEAKAAEAKKNRKSRGFF